MSNDASALWESRVVCTVVTKSASRATPLFGQRCETPFGTGAGR